MKGKRMSATQTCDRCDNPATVYLIEIADGKPHRFHLCQKCANQANGDRSPTIAGTHKQTNCSFCGKSSQDVGPMIEGPNNIYICQVCIFQQEQSTVP
jgi:protein-arginine kinase activator protein McsA